MSGTSGTSSWFLDNAGIVAEAYSRIGLRPNSLVKEHFFAATRSLNLALQQWSNKGVNLFQVDLLAIPLTQGVAQYSLPSNTVNILDAYLETYSLQTIVQVAPNFTTVSGSNVVTVTLVQNNLVANNWIDIVIPVAVGGLILQGLYQVQTVFNANSFSINAASNATSSVNNGGALPVFTTTLNSSIVSTLLTNHGLSVGNTFVVQEPTTVGGLPLTGNYIVATVPDANHFTFNFAIMNANATQTATENGGNAYIETQYNSAPPTDRILTSISRTDYASIPNKLTQAPPSTFWFDRLSPIPVINLWDVPDGGGPYTAFVYRMRRIQDAYTTGGQTADIPYRFIDALCADLAMRLARKYAPALVPAMKEEAELAWSIASEEDRERVTLFLCPDTSSYFR